MKEKRQEEKQENKNRKKGRKIFYIIYFAYIILFFALMAAVLYKLQNWLRDYEASQPTGKCQEVFAELFENPDWEKIYDLSGAEDTIFEGRESYAAYMTKKVGGENLDLMETSAGLSGNKKYIVKLGEEKLLYFTLVSSETAERGITSWSLGQIELVYSAEQSVKIWKTPGHTVLVNGVELGEEYTVQRVETLAENYLPEGVHGVRKEMQMVEGLLTEPEIQVIDESGEQLSVIYDSETGTYAEPQEESVIASEEKEAVLAAAKAYSQYMLGVSVKLSDYFDTKSDIYKVIRRNENWVQNYSGYSFSEAAFSDYCRYTDDLFSVRVSMTLEVKRGNGTVKEYEIDSNFFMERQEKGGWLAVNMANVDVQQPVTEVRLTYSNEEGVLETVFVRSDAKRLETPHVTAPQGKEFAGWMKEETDSMGRKSGVLMFVPDEDGVVVLPEDYELEPLTLYPLFE